MFFFARERTCGCSSCVRGAGSRVAWKRAHCYVCIACVVEPVGGGCVVCCRPYFRRTYGALSLCVGICLSRTRFYPSLVARMFNLVLLWLSLAAQADSNIGSNALLSVRRYGGRFFSCLYLLLEPHFLVSMLARKHTTPPPTSPTCSYPSLPGAQFLGCVEILLGTVGTAPPTLVDGAAAGLGAVLGEMHGEGLFAAAFSAEVSLPVLVESVRFQPMGVECFPRHRMLRTHLLRQCGASVASSEARHEFVAEPLCMQAALISLETALRRNSACPFDREAGRMASRGYD